MEGTWAQKGFSLPLDQRPQVILVFQGGDALGSYQAGGISGSS
jgi:hypothetical protein